MAPPRRSKTKVPPKTNFLLIFFFGKGGGVGEEDPSTSLGMTEGIVGMTGGGLGTSAGGVGGAIGSKGGRPTEGISVNGSGIGGRPSPPAPAVFSGWLVSLFIQPIIYASK